MAVALMLCTIGGTSTGADSLYGTGSFFATLFSDHKAVKVGDVLQIIIMESASATHTAERSNQASTQSSLGPGAGKLGFLPLWGYSGSSQSAAKGGASRTESFVGRVSVTVRGISPAGNLMVEGERAVQVNKDLQKIKLSGEVRPQDVQRDNTVLSTAVANAHIEYEGSDPGKPGSKVGILTGLLHWLF
jgi:flagellar L-ring protein FlgH